MDDDIVRKLRAIQWDCVQGNVPVRQAVDSIDTVLGGVARTDYKAGVKFAVATNDVVVSLPIDGLSRKYEERNHALAIGLYDRAGENGYWKRGEVHISREASTKHHTDGLDRLRRKYGPW